MTRKFVQNYINAVSRQNWQILFNLLTNKSEQLIHEMWFLRKYLIIIISLLQTQVNGPAYD